MKSNLENFINHHREEFDSEEMKINWEKIRTGMTRQHTPLKRIQHYWWVAAATVGLIATALIFLNSKPKTDAPITKADKIEIPSDAITDPIDPAISEQMKEIVILIEYKQNELNQNQKSQPELYKQFLKDNNHLDSSYNYLKSKLAANPNKEVLLDAMIQNLQLKLDILNKQLQIIKQSKHKKTNNESKTI